MMWLATGSAGAAGLIGGAPRNAFARRDSIALSVGLGGAAATLTGGVIAAGIIALSRLAAPSLRSNPQFRRAWGRALILPGCVVFVMATLISLPHAEAVQGTYWTTRYAPLSVRSAAILLMETVAGDQIAWLQPQLPLGGAGMTVLTVLLLILFSVCIRWALRDRSATLRLLPFVALGAGFPTVLLALSVLTSRLVGRYFLPAVAAVMMHAAVGAATLSRQRPGASLMPVLIVALCAASLNQSLSPGLPRDWGAENLSGLILSLSQPGTLVLLDPEDDIGSAVRTNLPTDRLFAPVFPVILETKVSRAALAAIGEGPVFPVFLVLPAERWLRNDTPVLPAPTCLREEGAAVVVCWAERPTPCLQSSG
jgi:hypothetical protein